MMKLRASWLLTAAVVLCVSGVACEGGVGGEVESTVAAINAGPSGIAINAGGPAGRGFIADTDFVGGSGTISHANAIDRSKVTNPAPEVVYQTARVGGATYTIPGFAAASTHVVRLHFAETFFTAAGSRIFDVYLNGVDVLPKLDVFAVSGAQNRAYIAEFKTTASSTGTIVVKLQNGSANQAMISGIQILPEGCALSVPGVSGHPNPALTYPQYPGFTLALAEEFDCPLDLDSDAIWTWSDGGPSDGQVRYQKSAIAFGGGLMTITATNASVPSSASYSEPAKGQTTGVVATKPITSGELRTKYNNYRYGRYEFRIKAPSANPGHELDPTQSGNFLVGGFVFRTPEWQEWNEIDNLLEANIPTQFSGNLINALNAASYPGGNAAPWSTSSGLPANYKIIDSHTYAFEWTPSGVKWFVDGGLVHSFTGTAQAPIPTNSTKIMLNQWVFTNAAAFGDPTKNIYPFSTQVDYVRFYRWNQETTYPCASLPGCLRSTDTDFSQNNPSETTYP
jgi:beta-glucanase (GH16 family)